LSSRKVKLLPVAVFVVSLLDKLGNRGTGSRSIDLSGQFDLHVVVCKGEFIRIEASVPGSSYDLLDVRSWFFGNRKMKVIKLA
jgi:hypothetical protein